CSADAINSTTCTTSKAEEIITRSPSATSASSSGTRVCADVTIPAGEVTANDCPPSATAHTLSPKPEIHTEYNSLFISSPARTAVRVKHNFVGEVAEAAGTLVQDKKLSPHECTQSNSMSASVSASAALSFDSLCASMTARYVAQVQVRKSNNRPSMVGIVAPFQVPFDIDSPPLNSASIISKSSPGGEEGAPARISAYAPSSSATSSVGGSIASVSEAASISNPKPPSVDRLAPACEQCQDSVWLLINRFEKLSAPAHRQRQNSVRLLVNRFEKMSAPERGPRLSRVQGLVNKFEELSSPARGQSQDSVRLLVNKFEKLSASAHGPRITRVQSLINKFEELSSPVDTTTIDSPLHP
ncbi:hypothetical protein GGI23_006757, partial [Coemansia sp. RSA 2559]